MVEHGNAPEGRKRAEERVGLEAAVKEAGSAGEVGVFEINLTGASRGERRQAATAHLENIHKGEIVNFGLRSVVFTVV
jgi:hypothetical protein